jgi:hypothetical protein
MTIFYSYRLFLTLFLFHNLIKIQEEKKVDE